MNSLRKILASEKTGKAVAIFLLITMVLSIIYAIVNITIEPSYTEKLRHSRSDYVLMILQCCLGIFVVIFPSVLERRWSFKIPGGMYIAYFIFLYCAIYLGEVQAFYYVIPHYDTILHAFSGAMLGAFGFVMVSILNSTDKIPLKTNPLFVAIFAFLFALAVGVGWEVYEYIADDLFGTNMQKYQTSSGKVFVGHEALKDTMKDLMVDAVSALVVSVGGYFSIKNSKYVREEDDEE